MRVGIIGAGASGLLCALELLKNGVEVDIFEKEDKVGKKLLQTGNGKCNFLNANLSPTFYNDDKFVAPIFKKYNFGYLKKYFEELNIISYADDQGRCYPVSNSSLSFLDILLGKIKGANIFTGINITSVEKEKNGYLLNNKYFEDIIVFANGSPAHLKDYNYDIFKSLNIEMEPFSPRLVPINVKEKNLATLEGLRLKGKVSVVNENKVDYCNEGEILFKDKGLSGIVVFSCSRYLKQNSKISIDIVPSISKEELKNNMNKDIALYEYLLMYLPKQFAKVIVKQLDYKESDKINTLNKDKIVSILKGWEFNFTSFGKIENAQICRGGILISELDDSLQIKKHPGIYAMGELINIDGECGGFNLSFAWASALSVSSAIIRKK